MNQKFTENNSKGFQKCLIVWKVTKKSFKQAKETNKCLCTENRNFSDLSVQFLWYILCNMFTPLLKLKSSYCKLQRKVLCAFMKLK